MNLPDADRKPPSYVPTLTEVVLLARETANPQSESIAAQPSCPEVGRPSSPELGVDLDAIVARVQQDLIHKLEDELKEQLAPLVDEAVKQAAQMAVRDTEMLLKKALRDVVVQQSGDTPDTGAN
jgi:hypothetical protein